jgi:hypothetical protein
LQLGDELLHRPARRELHDDEGDGHDAEQSRDHEQQASQDIGAHQATGSSTIAPAATRQM